MSTFRLALGIQHSLPELNTLLCSNSLLPRRSLTSERQARWDREIATFSQQNLLGSLIELRHLVEGLRGAGHRLLVCGSAAASIVLHEMGLTPLCPLENGFHFERFIDPGKSNEEQLQLDCLISMTGVDLLKLLWTDYSTQVVQREVLLNGQPYQLKSIHAARTSDPGSTPRITLQIETSPELILSNLLDPDQQSDCLNDTSTWELLAAADTDGITQLNTPLINDLLRNRQPRSLPELAVILLNAGFEANQKEQRVFQEDLMSQLHRDSGIPMREAWQLLRSAARTTPEGQEAAAVGILQHALENHHSQESALATWKVIQAKTRGSQCKAHIYTLAHLALQAACVKAHHTQKFHAVSAVLQNYFQSHPITALGAS
jgi:hypothetical protein